MKRLLCLLAVVCGMASVATAGPNSGGVLWVHDTGIEFAPDLPLPPASTPPADCAGVDSQQDVDGVERVWKVYAAFAPGSHPRLKTCGWAIRFPEADSLPNSFVRVTGGGIPDEDGPGTDFYIEDLGFPTASGGQIGQSFPTGPRTSTVVALFYFYGYGYNSSGPLPVWTTAEHSVAGNRFFGDEAFPAHLDPIMGYGSLGFGTPGATPCPVDFPEAACCAGDGACTVTEESDCPAPNVWFHGWYVCDPNPCPQLLAGACCFTEGECSELLPVACVNAGGVFYDGPCSPNPCPQPPVGACCFPDGACSILSQTACASSDGVFYDGACEPNPCPQPGACCLTDGSCAMLLQAGCSNLGGTFYDGPCTPNPCPQPPSPGAGDTIGNPFVLPEIPCWVSGTSVGFTNDYDEACPYSGSTAPDVVYAYSASGGVPSINIDLCHSSYDTKVYVYDSTDLDNPIACNDDFYFGAPCYTYSSYLGQVPVVDGQTYYIVIDGYGPSSGFYAMSVSDGGVPPPIGACCAPNGACTVTTEVGCAAPGVWQGPNTNCNPNPCPQPPPITCTAGALLEGEPLCQDGYVDNYNGGCNSTPVIWQAVAPQAGGCAVVCGKSCTYLLYGGSSRDTDWYLSNSGGLVSYTMTAEFPFVMALFTGTDCAGLVYTYYVGQMGETGTLAGSVPVGQEVGFFAANSGFSGFPAEQDYILNICGIQPPPSPPGACCTATGDCIVVTPEVCASVGGTFLGNPTCLPGSCESVATEITSWGSIKARFLQPDAQPVGAACDGRGHACRRGSRRNRRRHRTVTTRSAGGSVPELLGTTRPPKPGSSAVRGGK